MWKMSSLKAYKPFSVPKETLERCVKYFPFSRGVSQCAFRKRDSSTAEFRYELVQGCITIELRYYGMRSHNIKARLFSEQ
jgi:hypothetical protein